MNISAVSPTNTHFSVSEKRKKDEIKVANVFEAESDSRQDSLSYNCYENAYQAYKRLGDEYNKKRLLKKLDGVNRKILKNLDSKDLSNETNIKTLTQFYILNYKTMEIEDVLKEIVSDFFPNFYIRNLFPFIPDTDSKNNFLIEDITVYDYCKELKQKIQGNRELLTGIFNYLIEEKGLTAEHIIKIIKNSKKLEKFNSFFIEENIKRFFEKDYFCVMQSLPNQFENLLAYISNHEDFNPMRITTSSFENLSYLIQDSNLRQYLIFLLTSELGFNFKNKSANGKLKPSEITQGNCVLLIHLLLCLLYA